MQPGGRKNVCQWLEKTFTQGPGDGVAPVVLTSELEVQRQREALGTEWPAICSHVCPVCGARSRRRVVGQTGPAVWPGSAFPFESLV
jgi:hypothetical protein